MFKVLGHHAILNLYGVKVNLTMDKEFANSVFTEACILGGATVLQSNFHEFGENCGITGFLILSESHAAMHCWNENRVILADIFVCGTCDIHKIVNFIVDKYNPIRYTTQILERGIDEERNNFTA